MSEEFIHRLVLPVGILDMTELSAQVLQPFDVILQLQIVFAHLNVQVKLYPYDTLLGGCQLLVDFWLQKEKA